MTRRTRRRGWRWPLIAAFAGLAAFIAGRLLMDRPWLAESLYSSRLGPAITRPLSLVTGIFPFALWEVLAAAWVIFLAGSAVHALHAAIRKRRRWGDILASGLRRALRDGGLLVFGFYLLWGLNYARPPFEVRQGWPDWEGVDAQELARLAEGAVEAANAAYVELHGSEDAGEPTRLEDLRRLEAALDAGWQTTAGLLELDPIAGARYGRVKRPLSSELFARFGISGIYLPWTAEANVVRQLPAVAVPTTMGHEKAHQRGISSEAEAGFVGFIAAATADDPLARYSAAFFAQRQLLADLAGTSPDRMREIAETRLPGVRRDLADLAEYARRYRGVVRTVGTAVNDRYLRAHGVPGGVRNYGHATRLLITWARQSGTLLPGPDG